MPPILFFSLLALFFLLFDYGILPASIVVVVVGGIFCLDSRVPFWMYLLICAASILLLYWLSSFLNYKLIKLRFLASDIVERVREHSEIGELHMIELSFLGVSIKGSAGSVNNIVEYRKDIYQLKVLMHHSDTESGSIVGVLDFYFFAVFKYLSLFGLIKTEKNRHEG